MKSEKEIEKYLIKRVREEHGLCLKWTSPGTAGVPDRIIITDFGEVFFVELKAEGRKNNLSEVQKNFFRKLDKLGKRVRIFASYEDIDKFIKTWPVC